MPYNSEHARHERRHRVSDLYLRGETQHQIAARLGISQSQVSRDLAALRESWHESAVETIATLRAEQLAKIAHLERTCWEAWEKSKRGRYRVRVKSLGPQTPGKGAATNGDTAAGGVERIDIWESCTGDPRYLSGVMWCIEKRIALLNLAAPHHTVLTRSAPERREPPVQEMSDEELAARLAAILGDAPLTWEAPPPPVLLPG